MFRPSGMLLKFFQASLIAGIAVSVPVSFGYSQDLQIHVIDVGQGSSELIIGPDGTSILIDGGTSSMGTAEVIPYLDAIFPAGYRHLDYVIASHDDSDHYGGLISVLDGGYTAGTVYHCGENSSFGRGNQIPVGLVIDLGSGARATCVGRYGYFIDGTHGSTSADNNLSVCLLIEYGSFDYITAGDLESNETYLSNALISYPPSAPYLDPAYGVDVIHVNHHGSDGSSTKNYVNRLKHELAVISGGTSYSHPRWTAVDRLKGREYYSDGSGATEVTWSGCTDVYRTTYGVEDGVRAPEWDCPTLGDMVITYNKNNIHYYLNGTPYHVDEPLSGTPTPTPEGYLTPTATPTTTPTPSTTPTPTPTPSSTPTPTSTPTATPTPEGYRTPSPTPTEEPTPSVVPSPSATRTPWTAPFPFYDGFETGALAECWTVFTTDVGRVRVSDEYPGCGDYSVLLDANSLSRYSLAALVLNVDLSRQTDADVDLRFYWREFEDENHAEDGVFVSDDYGDSWRQVFSFNDGTSTYTEQVLSLSSLRNDLGFDFNGNFQIKFQFYDNQRVPYDGFALDEVTVHLQPTTTPTVTPTPEGYLTPTATPTPSPTPSTTPTTTPTPSTTPTPTPTPSVTPTPEGYLTPTPTPSVTPTSSVTPSSTPTPTPLAASLPFFDGFESGTLGDYWTVFTSSRGRVRVSDEYPYAGDYSALLDSQSFGYATSALILTADLSRQTEADVDLRFYWREFFDENHEEDGVFVSDDYGDSWQKVFSFNNGSSSYTERLISLSALRASLGLEFNDHFQVKFQYYDNMQIPSDGYSIDEVSLREPATPTPSPTPSTTPTPTPSVTPSLTPTPSPTPTPEGYLTPTTTPTVTPTVTPFVAPFPFYDGFESGGLAEHWAAFTTIKGRVRVTCDYPCSGAYAAVIDASSFGYYSQSELILTVDLSRQTDADICLNYSWWLGGESAYPGDGVYVSDDFGNSWAMVGSFSQYHGGYYQESLQLNALAYSCGFDLNEHFQVKFKFYDDDELRRRSYYIDDVRIRIAPTATPSSTPSPSVTPTAVPTATPPPSPSATPTAAPTATPPPSPTPTPPTHLQIDEGFDGFQDGVRPAGWVFHNCGSNDDACTVSGYFGQLLPSIRLDGADKEIATRDFVLTKVETLSFWVQGAEGDITSAIVVEEYYDSTWWTMTMVSRIEDTGMVRGPYQVSSAATRLKFRFMAAAETLFFDDVRLTGPATPIPTPSRSPTGSPTPSPAATASPTPTTTALPSASPTPSRSVTPPPSATPTATLSPSPSSSPSSSPSPSPSSSPSTSPTPSPTATPVFRSPDVVGDYNGDGTSDVALFRPSSGLWLVRGLTKAWFGAGSDEVVPSDYNGDGTWEAAVFRPGSGKWLVRGVTSAFYGVSTDLPVPADYDGDGTADIALFRPALGKWLVRNGLQVYYGFSTDVLVPADYGGDGTTDMAVFRPGSGKWLVRGTTSAYYGFATDTVVPGDYTGDGAADMAVFRPSNGKWLVRGGPTAYFGNSSDTVQPADYDGDGTWDFAVFRSASGKWLVRGLISPYYGASTDLPVTHP